MPRQSGLADREPCPWRIVDDVGGAFFYGFRWGWCGIWHTVKGGARSPVLGGQFAVWGGLFACCDCTLTSIRQREDPWNSIISGAATGGILAARAGPRAMARAAVVGGVLLSLIEGMAIMISRSLSPRPPMTTEEIESAMQQDVTAPPTGGGLFPAGLRLGTEGGNSGSSSAASATAPPSSGIMTEPYIETDGLTTFSTEATYAGDGSSSSSKSSSSWWPFGGQK